MRNASTTETMFARVAELGAAKSRQDVTAAMLVQHDDMVLDVPPLGARIEGKPANGAALNGFFKIFPDYAVTLEGHARADEELICWGQVRMTLSSNRYGVDPTGKTARFPAFFRFMFRDGLIVREYFLWDLAEACAQWGVSTDRVRARLFSQR